MGTAREKLIEAGLALLEEAVRRRRDSLDDTRNSDVAIRTRNQVWGDVTPEGHPTLSRLPHPLPYQGSKRNLASVIGAFVPEGIHTWYEPFAGSAAMTLWAAHKGLAKRFVIADSLGPITDLWRNVIDRPNDVADRYREIWHGQEKGGPEYFNDIRSRYNTSGDPIDLLYLICRCVKNAVRFNQKGKFTQSVDKRRLGMRPEKMRDAMVGASLILRGRTEVRSGDWLDTMGDAKSVDFAYLDPPYLGTTVGPDKRYAAQMPSDVLVRGLASIRRRSIPFALSYDGMTGLKRYGSPLPNELGLTRLLLHAGVSSQSTLAGRREETIESLYLTPGLAEDRGERAGIEPRHSIQEALAI